MAQGRRRRAGRQRAGRGARARPHRRARHRATRPRPLQLVRRETDARHSITARAPVRPACASCSRNSARPTRCACSNRQAGENRAPAYLAINPLGKVPAIVHDGAVVTEQVAIYIYLADLFPAAGLAPAIGDKLRGPYLRWLAFYGAAFEPALVDKHLRARPRRARRCRRMATTTTVISALGRPARAGSLSARRALHRGRHPLGHRARLDHACSSWSRSGRSSPPTCSASLGRPSVAKVNEEDAALAASAQPPT